MSRIGAGNSQPTAAATEAEPAVSHGTSPVRRYLLEAVAAPQAPANADLSGRHVTLVAGSAGVALDLGAALEARGATIRTVSTDPATELGDVDILVHLGAVGPSEPPSLPDCFAVIRRAVLGGARQLLVATGHGGRFTHRVDGEPVTRNDLPAGLGLAGLVRTIAREYPEIACRTVDLDPKESPVVLAGQVLAELASPNGPELIGYSDATRWSLRLVDRPLEQASTSTAESLGLTTDSVVLLTGGARGITARVAHGLARTAACHVVLWGRTPLPDGPRTRARRTRPTPPTCAAR